MEIISLKLDKGMLQQIDRSLKRYLYGTRTEFIRDAIRDKLSDFEKEEMLKAVVMLRGTSKRKTTDEELHKARERAFDKIEKRFAK